MKTKIIYVVTSTYADYYWEQLLVSVVSLRLHSPNANVCVLIDADTEKNITGNRKNLLQYINDLVVVDVPKNFTGTSRSRYIKTSIRECIKGPYLFIDTDTVIASTIDTIDAYINADTDFAAVKDGHCDFKEMTAYEEIIGRARRLGWDCISNDKVHYNSGVMFVNDTDKAHLMYEKWHHNWLEEFKKGFYFDQLALAKSLHDDDFFIEELSGYWNCQMFYGALKYLANSRIIHYGGHSLNGNAYLFRNKDLFDDIKCSGKIGASYMPYVENPREAFVGFCRVLGDADKSYYLSHLHHIALYQPKRFLFLQKWTVRMNNLLDIISNNRK